MFTVIFTQAARAELVSAQDWYEGEASGLGRRFRKAIDELLRRVSVNPQQFPVVFKNTQREVVRRFPYSLFFVVEGDTISVVACFHASRHPAHWQKRV